jgi:hypothetical protein
MDQENRMGTRTGMTSGHLPPGSVRSHATGYRFRLCRPLSIHWQMTDSPAVSISDAIIFLSAIARWTESPTFRSAGASRTSEILVKAAAGHLFECVSPSSLTEMQPVTVLPLLDALKQSVAAALLGLVGRSPCRIYASAPAPKIFACSADKSPLPAEQGYQRGT